MYVKAKGYNLSIDGVRKGSLVCQKWYIIQSLPVQNFFKYPPPPPLVKNTFALQMIVFIKAYFLFFRVVLTLGVYLSKPVCDNSDRDVHFVISVLYTCVKR